VNNVKLSSMKLNSGLIAQAALKLLNEVGLDGLTMRLVAKELGVQASALYWHVKNKQELLDAMATIMFVEGSEDVESPRRGVSWEDWVVDCASGLRQAMLRYRDGGKVLAGTNVSHPAVFRAGELTLRTLQDANFPLSYAARSYPVIFHYTVGFTIEEQARTGSDYEESPYTPEQLATLVDADRFPLMARSVGELFEPDSDAAFEHGLRIIIAGMRAGASSPDLANRADQ
jgi:TetR/AcrR family transcriptional regulator, tetracycline repressor protein